jgi:hypothetical protein
MTGGTILDIIPSGTAMLGHPRKRGMLPRHTSLPLMAAIAKRPCVVTFAAVGFFALSVQTVSILVVQVVDIAREIITSVTLQAGDFLWVALFAPCPIDGGTITVLMSPVTGMNVSQSNLFAMTQLTTFVGFGAIMAIQTDAHCGHIRRGECSHLGDIRVAAFTPKLLSNVFLMVEFNLPFRVGNGLRFFLIVVTHTAFLVSIDVVMALPADIHRRHHAIS